MCASGLISAVMSSKLQALKHSPLQGSRLLGETSIILCVSALRSTWAPQTRNSSWNCSIPLFFSGEGGLGSWVEFQTLSHLQPGWDFTRAQTLCAPSTCKVLVEIWAPLLISDGSSALLEILGPVPLGYSTSPGWWPDQRSLNLILALLPSTL